MVTQNGVSYDPSCGACIRWYLMRMGLGFASMEWELAMLLVGYDQHKLVCEMTVIPSHWMAL